MALNQLDAFMGSLRQLESGGNYRAIGPSTKYGRATGAYQFLDSTWGGFGGYRRAADAPSAVQDARARQLMTQYYRQFGSWEMVAVAWHGGPGAAQRAMRTGRITGSDVNMSTQNYARRVVSGMGGGGGSGSPLGDRGGFGNPGSVVSSSTVGGGSFMGDLGFQPMNTAEAKARAKELYGYLGWFVDHPEVGPVLVQGAKEGWGPERLQGALGRTRWWKTNSESARQWEALLASDIATAKRRINETGLSIRTEARKLGVPIGQNRLFQITVTALKQGWNEAEINLALASEMRWNPKKSETGEVGRMMQGIRELAHDYMVPVTRKQEWQWVRRIVSGMGSPEAAQAQFQKLAKARFPHLAEEIDAGITPAQYFQPYQNALAQVMETSPAEIDLMSSRWRPITSTKDRDTNKIRPMTISEAESYARSKPEWLDTQNAWESGTQAVGAMMQTFGMM